MADITPKHVASEFATLRLYIGLCSKQYTLILDNLKKVRVKVKQSCHRVPGS
jgi:hypothetical protein